MTEDLDERLNNKLEYSRDTLLEDFTDIVIVARNGNETYIVNTKDDHVNYTIIKIAKSIVWNRLLGGEDET